MAKKVNQSGGDLIVTSANNYYGEGVTQKEVQAFYGAMKLSKTELIFCSLILKEWV